MNGSTTQPDRRLVGRDREIAVLTDLLGQAKTGIPRFAQITGEPGIGKTYLLAELARRADDDGWLVLSGRCAELEREVPFGLVIDAFDNYLASLDPTAWDRIAPDDLSELAAIFPSLRSLVSEPEYPSTAAERFRAHRAVIEMIERLAARQPLLLLLDDLQWADGASLEQAGYFLRRPPRASVLTVGSFRTGQADPGLATAVEALAREGNVAIIELGPLQQEDADKLVNGSNRAGLYEQSGGNPFFLLQLARIDGDAPRHAAADGSIPAGVAAAIAGELDGLSPTARAFADAAAVAGDPFDLDLAAEIAEIPDPEALSAVDELIARDLARPTAVPRIFQFRHPLVRSAVYDRTSPGARLAAHARAAAVLEARGATATERAHHVEHAARHGDEEAIAILREAGVEAAPRAPTAAVRWLEAALRLLPPAAPDEERLSMLVALGGAHAAIGRLEESRENLIEAVSLATADGPVPQVAVISACAAVEHLLGRHREAHGRVTDALERLPDPNSPEAASLQIDLAVDAFYRMDYDGMAEWGQRARETARGGSDLAIQAAAGSITAMGLACRGPVEEAHRVRSETAEMFDRLTDDELARRMDTATWLAAAEFYLEDYAAGIGHAERGIEIARATAQGEVVPGLAQALANLLFVSGRPADASELLTDWVESARLSDNGVNLAWSLLNRSMCAIYEGDLETARVAGEEARELARNFDSSPVSAWAGAVLGGARLEAGDAAGALEALLAGGGSDEGERIPGAWRAYWFQWLARAYLDLGRAEDAAQAADRSLARAEEFGLGNALAVARMAAAYVALDAGDVERAAEEALAAAAHSDAAGARGDAAASRTLAGQALARAGDKERAIAELERAVRDFEAGQAPRRAELPESELRKLGRGKHRRTRAGSGESGVESLTGRELEIARLVVDRRTNAEIAAELFLSVKTVETHMRNIFRKLDVSSRVEVARVIEQADAGA